MPIGVVTWRPRNRVESVAAQNRKSSSETHRWRCCSPVILRTLADWYGVPICAARKGPRLIGRILRSCEASFAADDASLRNRIFKFPARGQEPLGPSKSIRANPLTYPAALPYEMIDRLLRHDRIAAQACAATSARRAEASGCVRTDRCHAGAAANPIRALAVFLLAPIRRGTGAGGRVTMRASRSRLRITLKHRWARGREPSAVHLLIRHRHGLMHLTAAIWLGASLTRRARR